MSDSKSGPSRRWTVIAAALLVAALGLIVMYTNRRAFFSPIAVVVVAAIGLAALLLQLRFRRGVARVVHAPLWLNGLGILLALCAMFGDLLRLSTSLIELAALAAVGCFGISGFVLLGAIRKQRVLPK